MTTNCDDPASDQRTLHDNILCGAMCRGVGTTNVDSTLTPSRADSIRPQSDMSHATSSAVTRMTRRKKPQRSPASIFTDHFSGPRRAIGPVCVCVCLHLKITVELNDL